MLKRLAGATLICFLAGGALAQPGRVEDRGDPSTTEGQAQPQSNQPAPPPSVQDLLQRIAAALEAANVKGTPADEADRAKRDVDAQERMAKWAKWMFWTVFAQTWLTLLGIFLIWRTLLYTRTAAVAARDAVDEAKRATKAAEAGVEETRRIGEAEARAYIGIDLRGGILRDMVHKTRPQLFGSLQNTGHSPAFELQIYTSVRFTRLPADQVVLTVSGTKNVPHVLSNASINNVYLELDEFEFSEEQLAMIKAQQMRMEVLVSADFVDIFGKPQRIESIRYWGAPESVDAQMARINCSLGIRP